MESAVSRGCCEVIVDVVAVVVAVVEEGGECGEWFEEIPAKKFHSLKDAKNISRKWCPPTGISGGHQSQLQFKD